MTVGRRQGILLGVVVSLSLEVGLVGAANDLVLNESCIDCASHLFARDTLSVESRTWSRTKGLFR